MPTDDMKVVAAIFLIFFLFGMGIGWLAVNYGPEACRDADFLDGVKVHPADRQD